MKTQFPITKYGFTMIEVLIVISILGFLFYTLGRTDFRPQENLNKAERLGNRISGVLHDALLFTALGRMDKGSPPQAITGATVTISTSTGISWYYSPSFSGSYGNGVAFFDNDLKYKIQDIIWSWATQTGSLPYIQININSRENTFVGLPDASGATIAIQTEYVGFKKKVLFDRRTGRIEVNKN